MSHGNKGRRQCKARSRGGWPCWRREGHPGEHTNGGVPFKAVPQPEDVLRARTALLEAFVEAWDAHRAHRGTAKLPGWRETRIWKRQDGKLFVTLCSARAAVGKVVKP